MENLTLNEYQKRAMTTCMPSCDNFAYMMLNLMGEVGEFASKVAKQIRKGHVGIGGSRNHLVPDILIEEWLAEVEELKKEAGDMIIIHNPKKSGVVSDSGFFISRYCKR